MKTKVFCSKCHNGMFKIIQMCVTFFQRKLVEIEMPLQKCFAFNKSSFSEQKSIHLKFLTGSVLWHKIVL